MTEPGGPAWRQTTFFPFAVTSELARGTSLRVNLTTPSYETSQYGEVGVVDAAATHDAETGITTIFAVNRSLTETVEFQIDVALLGSASTVSARSLHDSDIHAANTLAAPERVQLRPIESTIADGTLTIELPPVSWAALRLTPVE